MKPPQQSLAPGLGWMSLGIGLAEVVVPARVARLVGAVPTRGTKAVLRASGLRELAQGAALLGSARTGLAATTRVAGDVLDLGLIANVARKARGADRRRALAAAVAVIGATGADALTAVRDRGTAGAGRRPLELTSVVTVSRPRREVYERWRDLSALPTFMSHLTSVHVVDDLRSHWVADAPLGTTVEWDAEITEDVPGEVLAWRSLPGGAVDTSGAVRFSDAPGGRGTEVRVELAYAVPGGRLGDLVAKLFGEQPKQQVEDDLRRFKQVLETGEVVVSDGSPRGQRARSEAAQQAAQPAGEPARP